MSERMFHKQSSRMAWAAPLLVSLALAACQEPKRAAEYRDDFPLTVSPTTVSLSLEAPSGQRGLTGQDALDFERFVRDYHNRGRKALTLKAPAGQSGRSGAEKIRSMLVGAGIPKNEIGVVGAGSGNIVTMSFNAFKAEIPECGRFTSKTTPNWTNRRHADYGCATRRNLGLMVKDPHDLKQAQPVSGADGPHAVGVISGYRSGAAAAAETPATAAQ